MKTILTAFTSACLCLGGGALTCQEPPAPPAAKPADEIPALVQKLGSDSYKERLEAERRLREIGADAKDALREAADSGRDPEVQWRARRLLRQLERGDRPGLEQRPQRPQRPPPTRDDAPDVWTFPGLEDLDQRFDRMFRDLERDFRIDIPRQRFFQDDFFRDLQQQMDDMRARMQDSMRGGIALQRGRGLSMRMGPDGVRVEVKSKDEKGEESVRVYEAPDLETFRSKYPGVLEENGLGGIVIAPGLPGDRRWGALAPLLPQYRARAQIERDRAEARAGEPMAEPPADRRLGVVVRHEIDPAVRTFLGLPEGRGLLVEEVQAGTLAESLGLKVGDIVLKIAGRDIAAVEDVHGAVGSVEAGQPVEVVVNRRGAEVKLSATKTAAAKAGEGGLERRSEIK